MWPFGDEGPVETAQRDHIGDGAERDEMQKRAQIGLSADITPETASPQFARDRDHCQKRQTNGSKMPEAG